MGEEGEIDSGVQAAEVLAVFEEEELGAEPGVEQGGQLRFWR